MNNSMIYSLKQILNKKKLLQKSQNQRNQYENQVRKEPQLKILNIKKNVIYFPYLRSKALARLISFFRELNSKICEMQLQCRKALEPPVKNTHYTLSFILNSLQNHSSSGLAVKIKSCIHLFVNPTKEVQENRRAAKNFLLTQFSYQFRYNQQMISLVAMFGLNR